MLQCTQHTVVVDRGGDIVGRRLAASTALPNATPTPAWRIISTSLPPSPNAIERLPVDAVMPQKDVHAPLAFVTPRMLMSAMSGLQRLDTHSGNSRMIRSSCSGDMKTHI